MFPCIWTPWLTDDCCAKISVIHNDSSERICLSFTLIFLNMYDKEGFRHTLVNEINSMSWLIITLVLIGAEGALVNHKWCFFSHTIMAIYRPKVLRCVKNAYIAHVQFLYFHRSALPKREWDILGESGVCDILPLGQGCLGLSRGHSQSASPHHQHWLSL